MVDVLLKSVHEFSTRPIVVMGIGSDPPFSTDTYPRMIARKMTRAPRSVYFNKLKAVLECPIKFGGWPKACNCFVYCALPTCSTLEPRGLNDAHELLSLIGVVVESDDIVNWNVDRLFAVARKHAKQFPLLPRHPQSTQLTRTYAARFAAPGYTPVPYGHAHLIYSHLTMPFFKRTYEDAQRADGPPHDELAVNNRLWMEKATDQACLYDPYAGRYKIWVNQKWPAGQWDDSRPSGFPGSKVLVAFHLIHGDKTVSTALSTLEDLKRNRGKPVYTNGTHWAQTAEEFGHHPGVYC